jgi:dipeptidyl aminopeptidase/acylaminoacyl peptidase
MGAAQILQSLQDESRFCAVAAESAFSNFQEITYDRIGQFFKTGPWLGRTILRLVVEAAFGCVRLKYRLNLKLVSPQRIASRTRVPILLIHGGNDSNIPIRHSYRIAETSSTVALWEVPDTDHCGAISTAPDEFEQRVVHWFDDHFPRTRDVAAATKRTRPLRSRLPPRYGEAKTVSD